MNKVIGKVLVRETGQGVPNLVVVLFDRDPATPSAPAAGSPPSTSPTTDANFGERIGSVLTDAGGNFELTFDTHLFAAGDPDKRPDLLLGVFAPEDSQGLDQPTPLPPRQRLLLFSNVARQDAGQMEAYLLRITRAQLERFAIPYGVGSGLPTRLADSVIQAWETRDAVREQLKPRIRQELAKIRETKKQAKALFMNLSAVPKPMRPSLFYVRRGEPYQQAQAAAIEQGVQQLQQYRGEMNLRLTEEQLAEMGLEVTNGRVDGDVDTATLLSNISRKTQGQTLVRARSLVEACHDQDVLAAAFVPPAGEPPPPPPPTEPGVDGGSADEQVLSRILGQIHDLETAGTEKVATRPDALRLQAELDALQLKGGPADAVALHDFNVLQIAFKHVWTEAFDETLRSKAEELYAETVRFAEERGLEIPAAEALNDVNQLREFIENVRGNAESLARLVLIPGFVTRWFPDITLSQWNTLDPGVQNIIEDWARDMDTWAPNAPDFQEDVVSRQRLASGYISQALSRVEKLIVEVAERLSEPYAFHIFAPNSYNFGILSTYRQRWEPLAYQAGDLVATIPLAPGETRKFTQRLAVRKSRSEREVEKSLSSRREEATQTSRADAEIVRKASTATNFKASAEGSFSIGIVSLSGTTDFAQNQAEESANVKKDFREAVVRAAQEYSKERSLEVTTSSSEDLETSTSGELSNPNNEITVTYLLYELQRRYRISEHLHRLTPVILVAQDVPAPHEIDEAWLLGYAWILRRVLLDDGLKPALDYLQEGFTGDELGLEVKKANWQAQKDLVGKLETSLGSQFTARDALREALVGNIGRVAAGGTSTAQDVAGAIATGGLSLLFGSSEPDKAELLKANRKAIEMMLGYADQKVSEIQQKLKGALEALQQATADLTRALERQSNKRTAIDQVRVHVKENILYYMQAIWSHEPPDQRFFRLYDLDVQWVAVPAGSVRLFGMVWNEEMGRPMFHFIGDRIDVFLPNPEIPSTTRKLVEVADLDNLLGFKGNYLMFPLKESCYLTTFMMQEFVEDYIGVRDPDPFGNYTTEELLDYIECAYHRAGTTDEDRATLRDLLIQRLTSPRRDAEEIVVPTGKLFIEALPGAHPLIEDFKLLHRAMDVKKVRAEVREAELENLRRAARLIAGDREDPDVEKKILIEGKSEDVIVTPDV